MLLFTACSPDDYGFGSAQYSAADLVAPNAYTVTIEGNRVILKSNIKDCTALWDTPNGRSQQQEMTLELPFAGDYEVTFGVETRAGAVFGAPYKFTIAQNDFTMLSNEKYYFLADKRYKRGDAQPSSEDLIAGISKKWYPNDKDYGLGCTGPVMYMTPYDPTNTGNYTEAEEKGGVYKDVPFGRANWAPNWDPGFQSWLIPDTDPYMDSYMEFTMDAAHGCVLNMYRGEDGAKGASTGVNLSGKFSLTNVDLSGYSSPLLSFSDPVFALHNKGFDEVCSNYTQDIIVAELTPYYLTLITKRTNSEGAWYLVWNFVSEEVKQTNGACIPKEEIQGLGVSTPQLPDMSGVTLNDIFTVESNGVSYVGSKTTYTVSEDGAYDIMAWNGAENKWQPIINGNYNDTWAPAPGAEAFANELQLSKNANGTIEYSYGTSEGTVTFNGNRVVFSNDIEFFTVAGDARTITIKGNEFTLLSFGAGDSMVLGIPNTKDEKGNVNSYLVVNLNVKPIGGPSGPVVVALTSDYKEHCWYENGCLRLGFHHYGDGGTGIFKDAASVALKKDQTIKVTFTLKPGITWLQTPKCALIDNNIKTTWEQGCFDLDDAVTVNTSGSTTVTLKNTLGMKTGFTATCLDLSIQANGFLDGYVDGGEALDVFESISCVIE